MSVPEQPGNPVLPEGEKNAPRAGMMSDFDVLFEKARAFHGHVCPGIALGTRLTIAGMRELGLDPHKPQRSLVVFLEIDRCGADAVQAITGCTLGHRTLKFMDYGKFAATFVDTITGNAVRVAVEEKNRKEHDTLDVKDLVRLLGTIPEPEILTIERVQVAIPPDELPGSRRHKVRCSTCGEQVMDNRVIRDTEKILCKNCSAGSYYTVRKS